MTGKAHCPYCKRLILVEWGFLMPHKEQESRDDCYGSGTKPDVIYTGTPMQKSIVDEWTERMNYSAPKHD